ncbi:hypothetical protein BDV95DRAFT_325301 [Massariosphaeria phaeospora]|uniref:Uncharacterized protein n=1 Tax=Massariosphaeria phaeospora TaxID=100035 RepID=A0A7C8IBW6_9PLEO|nr:hypothetical protein BDV95DRAFT_325301 [Massariosphaeria phaeospora]
MDSVQVVLFHIGKILMHFEATVLHVPPSIRYFAEPTKPNDLAKQTMMLLSPFLNSFVLLPAVDWVCRRGKPPTQSLVRRQLECFVPHFSLTWVLVVLLRPFQDRPYPEQV